MALCKNPQYFKNVGGISPCGECRPCCINKARFWTFRLMMEALLHERTWWTTITYNDEYGHRDYINWENGEVFEHPQGTLNPRDIELFIKRVRKAIFPEKLRYFLVGEYGDNTNRPHYHICIFGHGEEIQRTLELCWTDPVSRRPLGFIDRKKCRPLDTATARYTCGYTLKKLHKKSAKHLLEGRYKEFISMSQGIGMEFAVRFADALRNKSGTNHILTALDIPRSVRYDGKNWPIDRYLRQKILSHLGLSDFLNQEGQKRYSKEMLRLQIRAELNPKTTSKGGITPACLQIQYCEENAQKILNCETKLNIKSKEHKL